MAISILMNSNKDLIFSSNTSLRQHTVGETVDFILPIQISDNYTIDTCDVTVKIMNQANQVFKITPTLDPTVYQTSYRKYSFTISNELAVAGPLKMVVEIIKMNGLLVDYEVYSNELVLLVDGVNPVFTV